MFVLRFHEDQTTGLVAVCDVCGADINDASEANLLWNYPLTSPPSPGDNFKYVLACKQCDSQANYKWRMSQDLHMAIGYLCNNTKIQDLQPIHQNMLLCNI
jgi:hypothetical protein